MDSIKCLLVFLSLAFLLSPNEALLTSGITSSNTSFFFDFSALSQPQISIYFAINSTSITNPGNIQITATNNQTKTTLISSSLNIAPGMLQANLIPPCEVSVWGTKNMWVTIVFNTAVYVPVYYAVGAEETDPFQGNVELNSTVSVTDSLPYANYWLTLYVPNSVSSSAEYTLELSVSGTGNTNIPFSELCVKVGTCFDSCTYNSGIISTPTLTFDLTLAPGIYYYANFTVAPQAISQAMATISATLLQGSIPTTTAAGGSNPASTSIAVTLASASTTGLASSTGAGAGAGTTATTFGGPAGGSGTSATSGAGGMYIGALFWFIPLGLYFLHESVSYLFKR